MSILPQILKKIATRKSQKYFHKHTKPFLQENLQKITAYIHGDSMDWNKPDPLARNKFLCEQRVVVQCTGVNVSEYWPALQKGIQAIFPKGSKNSIVA